MQYMYFRLDFIEEIASNRNQLLQRINFKSQVSCNKMYHRIRKMRENVCNDQEDQGIEISKVKGCKREDRK